MCMCCMDTILILITIPPVKTNVIFPFIEVRSQCFGEFLKTSHALSVDPEFEPQL